MKKFKIFITAFTILFSYDFYFSQPNHNWSVGFGDNPIPLFNYDTGRAVDMDKDGNVYVAGSFYGSMDLDPGAGTYVLNSNGDMDAFIAKYDKKGALLWAFKIGSVGQDIAFDVKIDEVNKLMYVGGYFGGTADFNPSITTNNLTSAGAYDCFLAKYDIADDVGPLPLYNWAIRMGGTGYDRLFAIALDNYGNIFATGSFEGTSIQFNTKAGCSGSSVINSTSYSDIFVAMYTSAGCCNWAHGYGGGYNFDEGLGVATDASGNAYFTGLYRGTIDFDPSSGAGNHTSVSVSSVPTTDIFMLKLNPEGDYEWSNSFGGTGAERGNDIKTDATGGVIITGDFDGPSVDFDPSGGTSYVYNSVGTGSHDEAYMAKYDNTGALIWANGLTSTAAIWSNGLALDDKGDIYITGQYSSSADFDPYGGSYVLNSASNDFYIAKYNGLMGSLIWASSAGLGRGYGIDVNCCKKLGVTGDYSGTVDFDFPSCSSSNLTSAALGLGDVFVASYELAALNSGPGGVGSAADNPFWLDAGNITGIISGGAVSLWPDRSGNNNFANQTVSSANPTYYSSQINGLPALSFSTNDYMTTSAIKCLNTNNISWYTVGKANTNTSTGIFLSSKYTSGAGAGSANVWNTIVTTTGNQYASQARAYSGTGGAVVKGWATGYQMLSAIWDGKAAFTLDGCRNGTAYSAATGLDAIPDGHVSTYFGKNSGAVGISSNYYLNGYIAEVFALSKTINQTQRVIIDNYLAAKYNLTITGDKYSYEVSYGKEVTGIGQAATNDNHLMARGPAIVEIGNPDNLQTNDYMLWGHTGASMSANIVNVPTAYMSSGGISMNRVWRVNETGTDVGNVTVRFYMDGIDNGTSTNYELLVDADGNLSNATRITSGYCWDPVNNIASWTGVNFANGDYFTIGCPTGAAFRENQNNNEESITGNNKSAQIKVFPSPNSGIFMVTISNLSNESPANIKIFDVVGKLVQEIRIENKEQLSNIEIKEKGLYIIKVISEDKEYTTKVVIQ